MIGSSREKASIVGWDGFKVRLKEMGLKNRDASKIMSVSEEMIRQYKKRGVIPSAKENDHHMIVKQFEYAAERIKNFHETEEPPRPRPSRKNFPATSSK